MKDNVTKIRDCNEELRKNLKGREVNVIDGQERPTGEKGNVRNRIISINNI